MPATEGVPRAAQVASGGDGGQAQDVVAEELPGESLDGRGVDRLDRGERLVECQDPVVERLLPPIHEATWRVSSMRSSRPPAR
jgi:hypothetical protein